MTRRNLETLALVLFVLMAASNLFYSWRPARPTPLEPIVIRHEGGTPCAEPLP